ncbi:type VI secretion system accessory protein TagJ [uncultured Pseudacidovorax sp.]|uniref:type VI secretion system accessory protein TagJ n=1 Tax=uncultured Pseudacidovorax sp. TaxID=679313 RepID=UPI0025DC8E30|nr:type VI secretion system accessory protein TagJ [uncultured Pseudacidovorax sp.]
MTPSSSSPTAQSFRAWASAASLVDALARAEAAVRARPQESRARWLLVELLCVRGDWPRAMKQLQAWAALSKDFDSTAHVVRGLIRAEIQRAEVFAGRIRPATLAAAAWGEGATEEHAPVPEEAPSAPAWLAGLADALEHAAVSAAVAGTTGVDVGDDAREAALSQAPAVSGQSNLVPAFTWVSDSDSRLGPVCEVVLIGAYRWIAFQDLRSIEKRAPQRLLDLVWSQADLVLRDGTPLKGYMPMRYPVATGDQDALLLGRETVWYDVGRTGVHAHGQKVWMSSEGDMPLLDLRTCRFDTAGQHAA